MKLDFDWNQWAVIVSGIFFFGLAVSLAILAFMEADKKDAEDLEINWALFGLALALTTVFAVFAVFFVKFFNSFFDERNWWFVLGWVFFVICCLITVLSIAVATMDAFVTRTTEFNPATSSYETIKNWSKNVSIALVALVSVAAALPFIIWGIQKYRSYNQEKKIAKILGNVPPGHEAVQITNPDPVQNTGAGTRNDSTVQNPEKVSPVQISEKDKVEDLTFENTVQVDNKDFTLKYFFNKSKEKEFFQIIDKTKTEEEQKNETKISFDLKTTELENSNDKDDCKKATFGGLNPETGEEIQGLQNVLNEWSANINLYHQTQETDKEQKEKLLEKISTLQSDIKKKWDNREKKCSRKTKTLSFKPQPPSKPSESSKINGSGTDEKPVFRPSTKFPEGYTPTSWSN